MAKKRSIADVWVTCIPETSQIAEKIAAEFRKVDPFVREAARRWKKEIDDQLRDAKARVDADIDPAQREVRKLDREIEDRPRKMKVEVDQASLNKSATALRASHTNLIAAAVAGGTAFGPQAIASTATAVANMSGVIGLLPAAVGTAALAFGALKIATLGFGDALKDIRDPEKFGEAIKQLSPNMQDLASSIRDALPAIDQLKFTVADAFGDGLGRQFTQLSTTYLPMFRTVMSQMAASANNALTQVSQSLQTPQMSGDIGAMTGNMAQAFNTLSNALAPIVKSFVDIGLVGSGFMPQLADAATRAAQAFSQFVGEARASGDMQSWIQTGIEAFKQLGRIVGDVFGIIQGFMTAAPAGGGLFGTLEKITQLVNDFVNSPAGQAALSSWMNAVQGAMSALAPAASALLQALAPLAGLIGTTLSAAIQAIAPALTEWFTAMQPVISQLVGALAPVIAQITPVLGQLAMMFATEMVSGIQQILPVLVPFVGQMGQLLLAVTPLLPPLLQLVMSAMPAFQQTVAAVLPLLTDLTKLWTEQANFWVPLLVKGIGGLADTFTQRFSLITGVVQSVWNTVGPILQKMADLIGKVAGFLNIFNSAGSNAAAALNAAMPAAPAATGVLPTAGFGQPNNTADRRGVKVPSGWGAPATGVAPTAFGWGRGAAPVAGATGIVPTPLPIPPVSSYVAPPPATGKKSGSSGSSSMPTNVLVTPENVQAAIEQARSVSGNPYGYGGLGPGSTSENGPGLYDCSGFMSDLYAIMTGKPYSGNERYFTTEADFGQLGFVEGFDPNSPFNIGVHNGGGGKSSHMAGTLMGTNVESGGNGTLFGGKAKGANDPQFEKQFHLPGSMDAGYASMYGPGASSPMGDYSDDKTVRNAQQRVEDTANTIENAQMRLDELNAKGTATALQRKKAEDALAKAKREHADAIKDLSTAEQKAQEKGTKSGKGGNDDMSNLGGDLVGGMLEAFGFDGSLFKDPSQFGIVKLLGGMSHVGMDILKGYQKRAEGGGTGDTSGFGGGDAGGGGGLFGALTSFIPKPFGDLTTGGPQQSPGPGGVFLPGMDSGGGNGVILPSSQFMPGGPNSPGPGNQNNVTIDNSMTVNGPMQGDLTQHLAADRTVQNRNDTRTGPMLRSLP